MLPEVDLSLPWREDSDEPEIKMEFVPESGSVLVNIECYFVLNKLVNIIA